MAIPCLSAGERVKATSDRVCLRAAPASEAKVMTQVNAGDILESAGRETNGWLAVVPPEKVDMWVYGDLVKDGAATVGKLSVRAGPGINYQSIGRLDKGATLTVREEWQGWLKVAPPAGCHVWVSTNYVVAAGGGALPGVSSGRPGPAPDGGAATPPSDDGAGTDSRKPPLPRAVSRPSAPASVPLPQTAPSGPTPSEQAPANVPSVLADRELVTGVVQGRTVSYEGRLRPSGLVWRRPSKYRLVQEDDKGRSTTACYVLGNDEQLGAFEGRALVVHGKEYWLQGVRFSVVIPDRLVIPDSK
jgi:hypothetical protein